MMDNPYSSPTADSAPSFEAASGSTDRTLAGIARPTFLAWEKLRLVYIVVLGLATLLLAGPSLLRFSTLEIIVEGAVIANLCFFAGPIIETYVRWFGFQATWLRWFLFISGTLLTLLLAIAALALTLIPDQA